MLRWRTVQAARAAAGNGRSPAAWRPVTVGLAFYGGNWTDATSTIAGLKSSHAVAGALALANDGRTTTKELGTTRYEHFKKIK